MKLTEAQIDTCFEGKTQQSKCLIEIYKLVFPDWDNIIEVKGWPTCGVALWKYICTKFVEFDKVHHPRVINGDMWLNNGFSSSESVKDWEVSIKDVVVVLNDKKVMVS